MSRLYEPAEHAQINRAWQSLIEYAETRGRMGEARELNAIANEARKNYGSIIEARGALLTCLVDAINHPRNPDLTALWNEPGYFRDIMAYGWHIAVRGGFSDDALRPAFVEMTTARDMHIQARARASGLTQQQVAEVIRN
jgi:hypothetical protein